ncbi:hypothetical protein J6590_055703 [Homalodisca vitripennis]|nr:hypothetical protein J6590_055703 [Homalodisca vitripennis]
MIFIDFRNTSRTEISIPTPCYRYRPSTTTLNVIQSLILSSYYYTSLKVEVFHGLPEYYQCIAIPHPTCPSGKASLKRFQFDRRVRTLSQEERHTSRKQLVPPLRYSRGSR